MIKNIQACNSSCYNHILCGYVVMLTLVNRENLQLNNGWSQLVLKGSEWVGGKRNTEESFS